MIDIYTDGSATEMRSGWAFVIVRKDKIIYKESGLGKIGDTNQAMELTAFLKACEFAQDYYTYEEDATIYSDSAYIINCFKDKWYINWENNGWKNAKGAPVANRELWERIIPFFRNPSFHFEKVKGHAGNIYNELADELATSGREKNLTNEKKCYIIYKEVSKIVINYTLKKITIKETVDALVELIERNKMNGR